MGEAVEIVIFGLVGSVPWSCRTTASSVDTCWASCAPNFVTTWSVRPESCPLAITCE